VLLFSVIAALPAMLLAVAATVTFARSLDGWFSDRTRAIINNSIEVANIYVEEHGQLIRTDTVNMVRDLDAVAENIKRDTPEFQQEIMAQAGLRELPAVYVLNEKGDIVQAVLEDKKLPF